MKPGYKNVKENVKIVEMSGNSHQDLKSGLVEAILANVCVDKCIIQHVSSMLGPSTCQLLYC